jgi:hypothetical protein
MATADERGLLEEIETIWLDGAMTQRSRGCG